MTTPSSRAQPQPEVGVRASTATPVVDRPFWLEITADWASPGQQGLFLPPEVELPSSFERGPIAASSLTGGGTVFRVELVARESGSVALGPIEVGYALPDGSAPGRVVVAGPSVEVVPPSRVAAVAAAAVGGVLVVAGLLVWLRRRRKAAGEREVPSAARHLVAARRYRMAGDVPRFVQALGEALQAHGAGAAALAGRHAELVEAVRFGGRTPSHAELEALERDVERQTTETGPTREI